MWALARRSGLFVVSFAPLAAMFVALKWPSGWSTSDLALLALWLVSVAGLFVLLIGVPFIPSGGGTKAFLLGGCVVTVAIVVIGVSLGWSKPMALHAPAHSTPATAAGIAFGFCIAAAGIVAIILLNARRTSELQWLVTDPRDQGGAVAGYLATYLLPLLNPGVHGWRITAAYGIYLVTLYLVFLRSENLVLVNPTLYLFGYRVSDVQLDPPDGKGQRRVLLLSRQAIKAKMKVYALPLGDDCYFVDRVEAA